MQTWLQLNMTPSSSRAVTPFTQVDKNKKKTHLIIKHTPKLISLLGTSVAFPAEWQSGRRTRLSACQHHQRQTIKPGERWGGKTHTYASPQSIFTGQIFSIHSAGANKTLLYSLSLPPSPPPHPYICDSLTLQFTTCRDGRGRASIWITAQICKWFIVLETLCWFSATPLFLGITPIGRPWTITV